jgi:tetratricopeptide (TPR) repeat protein
VTPATSPLEPRRVPVPGRRRETDAIRSQIRNMIEQRAGGVVTLRGEAGFGKSHLVAAVTADAATDGCHVLSAVCPPTETSAPYSVFSQLFEQAAADGLIELLRGNIDEQALNDAARIVPSLTLALDRAPTPSPLTSVDSQRQRVFEAMSRALATVADDQPLVVVVDDLHWIDAESLAALEATANLCSGRPLMLLLAYRTTDLDTRADVAPPHTRFRDIVLHDCRLTALDASGVAELVEHLHPNAPAGVSGRFHTETGGNPQHIVETSRSLRDNGRSLSDLGDPWAKWDVPSTIRGVIHDRAIRLNGRTRRVLEMVAVTNDVCSTDLVANLCGIPDDAATGALEELSARGFVTGRASGWHISHDQVRIPVVEDVMRPHEVRAAHLIVAETLVRRGEDDAPERVAHHFMMGNSFRPAVKYLKAAAERSKEVYAYETAKWHLDRARELMRSMPVDPDLRYAIADLWERTLDALAIRDEHRTAIVELLDLAGDNQAHRASALSRAAWFEVDCGESMAEAEALGRAALAAAESCGDRTTMTSARMALGEVAYFCDRAHESHMLLEAAVAGAATTEQRIHALRRLGWMLNFSSFEKSPDRAREVLLEALRLARREGWPTLEGEVLETYGRFLGDNGDIDGAQTAIRQALDLFERTRSRNQATSARSFLALALMFGGQVADAIRLFDECVRQARVEDAVLSLGRSLMNRSALLASYGAVTRAARDLDEADELMRDRQHQHFSASTFETRSVVAMHKAEFDGAHDLIALGLEHDRRSPDGRVTALLHYNRAEVLAACEASPTEVRAVLNEATAALTDTSGVRIRPMIDALEAVQLARDGHTGSAARLAALTLPEVSPFTERPHHALRHLRDALIETGHARLASEAQQRAHDTLLDGVASLAEEDRQEALSVPWHHDIVAFGTKELNDDAHSA